MHPLVSRIHPSVRTAFFAFFIARVTLWMGLQMRTGAPTVDLSVATGTPTYRWLAHLLDFSGAWWPKALFVLAGEALLLAGVVAIYRFARRDAVPQTADRAAWFWAVSPAMLFAVPGSDWCFTYGLVALAFGAHANLFAASAMLAAAVAFRAEAILVFPGLFWLWWKVRPRDLDPAFALTGSLAAPAVFAATVLGGLLFADPGEMMAPELRWREGFSTGALSAQLVDFATLGLLAGCLLVVASTTQKANRSWLLVTLPVLFFAAITIPPVAGFALLPLAVPLFVQLGRLGSEPGFERVVLGSSLVALALGVF